MLSSATNFKVLSLIKLKSYISLSALLAFFLSFSLIGCGGKDSNSGGSEPSTFSVSFYDENLSFLEKQSVAEGIINPSSIITGTWYKAGENTSVTSHDLVSNVTFYAVSNVIEITDQTELDNIRTNLGGKYILLDNITLDDDKA
ncbi:MAG: hypothetical protein LBF71_05255, partial [Campylobacteraceae bacterium]|nr:hypothetical protein [Campylobacteraceae bacterium]